MADLVAKKILQCDYDTDPCLHTNESEKPQNDGE